MTFVAIDALRVKTVFSAISDCRGFQCNSGLCLPASFRCNDRVDCPDLSDEISCPWRRGYWQCDNGLSVPNNRWCDGVDDCYDNTDEEDCEGGGSYTGSDKQKFSA